MKGVHYGSPLARPWLAALLLAAAGLPGSAQPQRPGASPTPAPPTSAAIEPDGVSRETVTIPLVFPMLGECRWSDTFLAARDGGARRHHGQDLPAEKLRPLLACFDGIVSVSKYTVSILSENGYRAFYAHLNNDRPGTDDGKATEDWTFAPGIVSGARVVAGQIIGYCGDSGNAEATIPHLHFELHRVSDGAVLNAAPSLRAARRLAEPQIKLPAPYLRPARGEYRLDGVVRFVDPSRNLAGVGVAAWTDASGNRTVQTTPRTQYVQLPDGMPPVVPGSWITTLGSRPAPGDTVTVRLMTTERPANQLASRVTRPILDVHVEPVMDGEPLPVHPAATPKPTAAPVRTAPGRPVATPAPTPAPRPAAPAVRPTPKPPPTPAPVVVAAAPTPAPTRIGPPPSGPASRATTVSFSSYYPGEMDAETGYGGSGGTTVQRFARRAPASRPTPAPPSRSVEPVAVRPSASAGPAALQALNVRRKAWTTRPVTLDPRLCTAATQHAAAMARSDFFSHLGPDGRLALQRARDAGFATDDVQELLAGKVATAEQALALWLSQPETARLLRDPRFGAIGVGFVEAPRDSGRVRLQRYWVLLLAVPGRR